MVLPLLAAIPAIISAIGGATELFGAGKDMVEEITGGASGATTPEDLHREVAAMTPDQQERWAESMQQKVVMYEAQNGRLDIQGGRVDADTLSVLSQKIRDKIAWLRMATRPWAVRQMVRVILLPFYVTCVDIGFGILNAGLTLFNVTRNDQPVQIAYIASQFFAKDTIYVDMYQSVVWPAASIVMTYMTLRQFQKSKGDANPVDAVASLMRSAGGLVGKVRGAFK